MVKMIFGFEEFLFLPAANLRLL